jgi:hypothetical protein
LIRVRGWLLSPASADQALATIYGVIHVIGARIFRDSIVYRSDKLLHGNQQPYNFTLSCKKLGFGASVPHRLQKLSSDARVCWHFGQVMGCSYFRANTPWGSRVVSPVFNP